MNKNRTKGFFKILLVLIVAIVCMCSCDAVKQAAGDAISSVVNSAKNEISSAVSDQLGEVTSALNEASQAVKSAEGEVSSVISSVSKEAGAEISSVISSVSEEVSSEISGAAAQITTSTEETTTAPKSDKWYTFRNKTRYDEHYKKHGAEFGSITKEQYLQLANDLINDTSDRILHKYSEDGDYMYFNQDNNYFLVLSEDGYIRTFFIPSAGINYWNRQ